MSQSAAENDDTSESSSLGSLRTLTSDFRTALDEFRENWQRELNVEPAQTSNESNIDIHAETYHKTDEEDSADVLGELPSDAFQLQLRAEQLFSKAVELEKRGKVYDALPYYRKATQIVPDIEFKYYERQKQIGTSQTDAQKQQSSSASPVKSNAQITEEEEELNADLFEKFQNDLCDATYKGKMLLSSREAGVISTEMHISDLPPEIILCILRWVVSAQLDMRSLEQCAAVCKGMYLCARDDELWRLACFKVWGHNTGTLHDRNDKIAQQEASYYTWREMFLLRERVHFNGCYISKTTYLRMGENSFQDQYYRPVQLVEYYRYIRFLPDGKALMMTNADEPAQGVTKIKQLQNLRSDVLRGRYRLFGNTVTLMLQKQQPLSNLRQRRGSTMHAIDDATNGTQYIIEFRIMHAPKRRFGQLIWHHYSIVQKRNKVEVTSDFDIVPAKYPPLWFSPVRSYHLVADAPLA